MNYTKNIAIYLIVLMINLPIVFAQQMNVQKFSGRDGVNGFLREDDQLNVEVTAPGTLVPANLRIFSADTYFTFDNCAPITGGLSKCTYTTTPGFYGTEQYIIRWHDPPASQTPREEKTITLVTDSLAPTISTFSVEPLKSKDGKLQIRYVAEDRAFNPTDTGTCSGLKEIVFTLGNRRLFSEAGDKLCKKENTLPYDLGITSAFESGDICARATDTIGRTSSPSCTHIVVDKSAPNIKSMTLSEPDGSPLTHAHTNEEKRATVVVNIEGNEDDVQFESVIADLSKLNPALSSRRADRRTGNNYVWENVGITTPATCGVSVTAVDLLGNSATKNFNCVIGIDDTGPVAKLISTGFVEDGKQLLSEKGTISVEFEETGVGMNKANAFLDLQQLGIGGRTKADKCVKENNWKCSWNVRPTVSGTKQISVHIDTTDDLGNRVAQTGALRQDVIIDREPPIIESVEKIKLFHNTLELGVTTVGDTTEFYLNATGFETSFANFSDINDAEKVAGECEQKTCKFSAVIQNSGPYLANLSFSFLDKAGNKAERIIHLFVYGLSTEEHPNYWKLRDVTCSPSLIDRETASLKSHPVYCALNLEKRNRNAEAVTTIIPDPTKCQGKTEGLVSFVELKNAGYKSTHPTLAITLEATKFEVDDINISCPVEVYTKIGDLFTQVPETEEANFSLQFYNLPYGELSKNLNKRIDDAVDNAEGMLKWVGTIEKFVSYAGKMCQIKNMISSTIGALDTVLGVLGTWGALPDTWPYAKSADELRMSLCKNTKGPIEKFFMGGEGDLRQGIFVFLDKSCAFIECRLTEEKAKEGFEKTPGSGGEQASIIGSYFGGGGIPAVCNNVKGALDFGLDLDLQDTQAKLRGMQTSEESTNINVKDSIFWSTACFCVPGILHNLNKLRQINCRYATCMLQDVKEKGIPTSYCSDLKHQQTCQFVAGEIFSLLPIFTFLDKMSNFLQEQISNPFAALATLTGCLCGGCGPSSVQKVDIKKNPDYCNMPKAGVLYYACISTKTIAKIADATASIAQMGKTGVKEYWQTSNDWCEQMEKIEKRRGKQEAEAAGTTTTTTGVTTTAP